MAKSVTNNMLTPDSVYFVRGTITFSRVFRHTTDEEREKANKNRKHKIDKNYTTISLCNAQIICGDPTNPTPEETYGAESLYTSSKPENTGLCFTGFNKSRNLPVIRAKNETTGTYDVIEPKGELATGLDVTVGMRVFKGNGNNGVSLDTIVVNEPIRYYEGSDTKMRDAALATLGLTFTPATPRTASEQDEPTEGEDATENTAAAPTPPAKTQDPFSSVPTTQAESTAPVTTGAFANPFASASDIGAGNRKY